METLQDAFGDLASFSLANEFINKENVGTPLSLSLFSSEYINYIYIGLIILVIIIGFLIYKFNFVKRVSDDNETNSQCFGGICPR